MDPVTRLERSRPERGLAGIEGWSVKEDIHQFFEAHHYPRLISGDTAQQIFHLPVDLASQDQYCI